MDYYSRVVDEIYSSLSLSLVGPIELIRKILIYGRQ